MTTDPAKLEAQAKEAMTAAAFAYVAGGAGERATMDANRLAFRQWKVDERMVPTKYSGGNTTSDRSSHATAYDTSRHVGKAMG